MSDIGYKSSDLIVIGENIATTVSGPFASPVAINASFTRSGNIVAIALPAISAPSTAGGQITLDVSVPIPYQPAGGGVVRSKLTSVLDNSSNVIGTVYLQASLLRVFVGLDFDGFANTGDAGFADFTLTYVKDMA